MKTLTITVLALVLLALMPAAGYRIDDLRPMPNNPNKVQALELNNKNIKPLKLVPTEAEVSSCQEFRTEITKYDWDTQLISAISMAESGCAWRTGDNHLTYQRNGRTYGYSIGFLQVRIMEGREHCEHATLQHYVECAYNIYKGQGYAAWSVYTNGAYARFM